MNQIILESLQLYLANMKESSEQTDDEDEVIAILSKAKQAEDLLGQFNNLDFIISNNFAGNLKEAIEGCLIFDIGFYKPDPDGNRAISGYSNYMNEANIQKGDDEDCFDIEMVWADSDHDCHSWAFKYSDLESAEKLAPGIWLVTATNCPELVDPIWEKVQVRTFTSPPSDLMMVSTK